MNNPSGALTEEDDIELGDAVTYSSAAHDLNKCVVSAELLLNAHKGYYSISVGFNMFP